VVGTCQLRPGRLAWVFTQRSVLYRAIQFSVWF
jgi:hypothetical protein